MRNLLCLLFLGGFLFTNLSAATIDYTLIDLGSGEYQYDYTISGTIGADQAIDIDFPTAVNLGDPNDSNLSIPVSPSSDWTATILSSFGGGDPYDLQLMSNVAVAGSPLSDGPFEVTFDYSGSGEPGAQTFTIYQYDSTQTNNLGAIQTGGLTQLLDTVPEPSDLGLSGMALLAMGACWLRRRAKRQPVEAQ